jgi:hypothetical protein
MKKVSLLLATLITLFLQTAYACDDASTVINSVVNNGDGTYTVNLDLCVEFNGLEGNPDWFALTFVGGTFTAIVSGTPTTISTSSGDNYNAALFSGNTQVRWTTGAIFLSHSSSTLCTNITIVLNGLPTTVDVNYHDTFGPSCNETLNIPQFCGISALSAGTQTPCVNATNTYTQEVTLTYSNEPASGTIDVNGQSFAITSSPQTVLLTNLAADGNAVNVTAVFSADASCTLTSNALFTAPSPCNILGCTPDNGTWD